MIKIAVDAMGGDNAPEMIIKGVNMALKKYSDIEVTVFGDKNKINPFVIKNDRFKIVHTKKFLDMGESDPIAQYRQNKDLSMFLAMQHVKEGNSDVLVSAGPTQALVVGSNLIIKKMKSMRRVAIAPIMPSYDGRGKILLDAGANLDLSAEQILDLAVFASVVSKNLMKNENPKIGLINIGTESNKGRQLDIDTYNLLSASKDINFIGNVEPKEVLTTEADVLVTDGFTGNIVLKTLEGTAKGFGKLLKREIKSSIFGKIGYLFMRKNLKRLNKVMDSSEIGGAMLFGLEKMVIKAHGSSNDYAFYNAIRQARELVLSNIIDKVKEVLGEKNDENNNTPK